MARRIRLRRSDVLSVLSADEFPRSVRPVGGAQ
jgi:hypothetical protein